MTTKLENATCSLLKCLYDLDNNIDNSKQARNNMIAACENAINLINTKISKNEAIKQIKKIASNKTYHSNGYDHDSLYNGSIKILDIINCVSDE